VDHRVDLSAQAAIALRGDLPILAKNPVSSSNPNGDYLYGIGDADTQAVFIYDFDTRWAAGFGAGVIAPTGGDTLGSGKWQIMPLWDSAAGCQNSVRAAILSPSQGTT
jgi:hypothetical protein